VALVLLQGAAALKRYSCLIVDELHERSVESDLLLACIHGMMVPGATAAAAAGAGAGAAAAAGGAAELPSLKLVLMSATANVERYK
jgi:HrpA-like RNA helicase